MASGPITSWQINGETMETVIDFIFLCSKITADGDCSHEIKRRLLLGRKAMTNLDSVLKSRDVTLLTKIYIVKAMVFPVVMYRMWELDSKKGWALKNWCFWTVVLEKTLESLLDCKIQPVDPKGSWSWIFIGMNIPVVMYGCESWTIKKLSTKELMLLNCVVGEDSSESPGLQGDPTSPFWRRSVLGFLWKEWC